MEVIEILIFAWIGSAILIGCKTLIDQNNLLKLFRKQVDPPYPILPGEKPDPRDPFGIAAAMRQLNVMFSKHPEHPELSKLAAKVRLEFYSTFAVMAGGFFLLVLILIAVNRQR